MPSDPYDKLLVSCTIICVSNRFKKIVLASGRVFKALLSARSSRRIMGKSIKLSPKICHLNNYVRHWTPWLSAAGFIEANGASLVIRSNRKTSSGSLRNHTQLVDLVIKSQSNLSREFKMCGDQWRGKEKKWKRSIMEKWKVKEASRTMKDEEAKLS